MAKRIQKTNHPKRILTAAGIFAAGSIFGAAINNLPVSTVDDIPVSSSVDHISSEVAEEDSVQSLSFTESTTETETTSIPEVISEPESEENVEVTAEPIFSYEPVTEPETEPLVTPETESIADVESDWDWNWDWGEWDTVQSEPEEDNSVVYEPVYEQEDDWMKAEDTAAEPSVTILHEDSSMTPELIAQLEGAAFFWAPSGDKVHVDPACRSFKKGYTFAGTLDEAQSVRTDGWCGICSKNSDSAFNSYATAEVLATCYTYSDFLNGIPSDAFDD